MLHLYVDATPTSIAALAPGTPTWSMVQNYTDTRQIAFAEMAAAIVGLIQFLPTLDQPTNITLYMDSLVVFYSFVRGTGFTLRRSLLLQKTLCKVYAK
jgi:ribonuclease HI